MTRVPLQQAHHSETGEQIESAVGSLCVTRCGGAASNGAVLLQAQFASVTMRSHLRIVRKAWLAAYRITLPRDFLNGLALDFRATSEISACFRIEKGGNIACEQPQFDGLRLQRFWPRARCPCSHKEVRADAAAEE